MLKLILSVAYACFSGGEEREKMGCNAKRRDLGISRGRYRPGEQYKLGRRCLAERQISASIRDLGMGSDSGCEATGSSPMTG